MSKEGSNIQVQQLSKCNIVGAIILAQVLWKAVW